MPGLKRSDWLSRLALVAALVMTTIAGSAARGESCTTQSEMTAADRDAIAAAARGMAEKVMANDAAGLHEITMPEFAKDFTAIQNAVGSVSGRVKGAP